MAAFDVVGGGFKVLHEVFSHVSDGSYDDGTIHWVAESPMERGTEVDTMFSLRRRRRPKRSKAC